MPLAPRSNSLVVIVAVLGVLAAATVAAVAVGLGRVPVTGGRPAGPASGEATVVRVVDGDTVVVAVGDAEEPVRLIGIDTPESVARDRPNECFGSEASTRLAELLPEGTVVRLTRDIEPRDVYDRLLAYVQRDADGLFVNLAQVADGYAEASDYPPNSTYRDDFARAEQDARRAGRGLWSACGSADVPLDPGPPVTTAPAAAAAPSVGPSTAVAAPRTRPP
jgi:endonuclease YncB( thermonuclease family)